MADQKSRSPGKITSGVSNSKMNGGNSSRPNLRAGSSNRVGSAKSDRGKTMKSPGRAGSGGVGPEPPR